MRTTIDLPDDLYEQAKMEAVRRRLTLRELMLQGLSSVLNPSSEEGGKASRSEALLDVLQANNTRPLKPLSREAIYDR